MAEADATDSPDGWRAQLEEKDKLIKAIKLKTKTYVEGLMKEKQQESLRAEQFHKQLEDFKTKAKALVETVRGENNGLKEQLANKTAQLASHEGKQNELQRRLSDAESTLGDKDAEIARMAESLDAMKKDTGLELAALREEVATMQAAGAQQTSSAEEDSQLQLEVERLREQCESFQKQAHDAASQLQALTEASANRATIERDLQGKLDALEAQRGDLAEELQQANARHAQVVQELQDAIAQSEESVDELARVRDSHQVAVAEMEAIANETKQQLEEAHQVVHALKETHDAQNENHVREKENLERLVDELRDQVARTGEDAQGAQQQRQVSETETQSENDEQSPDDDQDGTVVEQLNRRARTAEEALAACKEELQALQKTLADHKTGAAVTQEQLTSTTERLDASKRAEAEVCEAVERSNQECETIKAALDVARKDLQKAKDQGREAREEASKLRLQLENESNEASAKRLQEQANQGTIVSELAIENGVPHHVDVSPEVEGKEHTSESQLGSSAEDNRVSRLEAQVGTLEKDVADKVAQLEDSRSQLREVTFRLDEASHQCQLNATQLQEKTAQLDKVTVQLEEESAKLGEKTAELEGKSAELEETSAQLAEHAILLDQTKVHLEEKSAQLEDKSAQLEDMSAQLEDKSAKLDEVTKQLEVKTTQLRLDKDDAVSQENKEHAKQDASQGDGDVESKLAQLENSVSSLESELELKTLQVAKARAMNDELKEKTRVAVTKLRQERSDLSAKCEEAQQRVESECAMRETAEHKLSQVEEELAKNKNEANELEQQVSQLTGQAQTMKKELEDAKGELEAKAGVLAETHEALSKATVSAQESSLDTERAVEQLKTVKELLRESTDRAIQLEKDIEQLKVEQHSKGSDHDMLETKLEEERQSSSALQIRVDELLLEVRAARDAEQDALKQLEQEELLKLQNDENTRELEMKISELAGNCNEFEARIEVMKSDLKVERDDAADKKRKAKAYVESLVVEKQKAVNNARVEAARAAKAALEIEVSKHAAAIVQLKESFRAEREKLMKKLEDQRDEVEHVKRQAQETVDATRKSEAALQVTEREMNSIIATKEHETERYKKLRQAAKQETLALLQSLEEQEEFIQVLDQTIITSLVPRAKQISKVAQEIEWNLDATISAASVKQQRQQRGRSVSRGANVQSSQADTAIEMVSSGPGNATMEAEASLEGESGERRLGRSKSLHKRVGQNPNPEMEKRMERFSTTLVEISEANSRVLDKVHEVCDLAIQAQSMSCVASLQRALGDCISKDRGTIPSTRSPRRGYARINNDNIL